MFVARVREGKLNVIPAEAGIQTFIVRPDNIICRRRKSTAGLQIPLYSDAFSWLNIAMKRFGFLYIVIVAVALLTACGGKVKGEKAVPQGGVFSFPADGIKKGEVKLYRYETGKKSIMFLIARAESGDVKAAFDACETCFPYHQGYRFEGDRLVCGNCGTSFQLEDLDKGKGNCMPVKIPFTNEGGKILINQADVEAGGKYF